MIDANDDSGTLSIDVPMPGFTASSLDNLDKLVAAKSWIIRKMAGAEALPICRDEEAVRFPWFKADASAVEIEAYSRLIAGLCETAKQKKRVVATERQLEESDNEKFKARCFLLSLGFIGKEYAQARKILLAPMSGNGSHKSGSHRRTGAPDGSASVRNGTEPSQSVAGTPMRCGDCRHHCYYTEG